MWGRGEGLSRGRWVVWSCLVEEEGGKMMVSQCLHGGGSGGCDAKREAAVLFEDWVSWYSWNSGHALAAVCKEVTVRSTE